MNPLDQYNAMPDAERLELLQSFADSHRAAFERFLRQEFDEPPTQEGDVVCSAMGIARMKERVA